MTNDEFIRNLVLLKVKKINRDYQRYDMHEESLYHLLYKNEIIIIREHRSRIGISNPDPRYYFSFISGPEIPIREETFKVVEEYFKFDNDTLDKLKLEVEIELRCKKIKQLNDL